MSQPQEHVPAYGEVDLTTCESEPIHVPGAIQPHGFLLGLERPSHRVVVASQNAAALLGRAPGSVLGADLADLLGDDVAGRVRTALEDDTRDEALHARLVLDGDEVDVDVVVHLSGERLVVEVERPPAWRVRQPGLLPRHPRCRRAAGGHDRRRRVVPRLAREVRGVLGFDRVMVYRFDAQWNGEVVAEDHRAGLEPFFGLRYPASDIPAQARRLYTLNWTRLIADVDYRPVRLEPLVDPGTGARWTCRTRCCAASRRSTSSTCTTWASPPRCRSRSSSTAGCGGSSPATTTPARTAPGTTPGRRRSSWGRRRPSSSGNERARASATRRWRPRNSCPTSWPGSRGRAGTR